MHRICKLLAHDDWKLEATFESGEVRMFDVRPLLQCEAFEELRDVKQFREVRNHGYFVDWDCEADLSADTIYCDSVAMAGPHHERISA
jgi:hypothetical protein